MTPVYIYNVNAVTKVVDGDTCDLEISLGFRVTMKLRFRLARINAAEMSDDRPEIQSIATLAKLRLTELLAGGKITIQSAKPYTEDKFKRWLAEIYVGDSEQSVNQTLIDEGLVKLYPEKF